MIRKLGWRGVFVGIFVFTSCATFASRGLSSVNPWAHVRTPSTGHLGPIGSYTAGCLDGAIALPMDGEGYQVMRPSRLRYFGHADLIAFLRNLGHVYAQSDVGTVLVGDLAQPRGGPVPSTHASHQIGLDVDIWYLLDTDAQHRPLTPEERESLSSVSLVDLDRYELDRTRWRPEHALMLKLAARQPGVERIFVHPAIKRELCEETARLPASERAWLHRIRPWYLHHDHFHVRLGCPAGSTACAHQEPVPAGDGCSGPDFEWWFSDEAKQKQKDLLQAPPIPLEEMPLPTLPAECTRVLNDSKRL